MDEDEYREPHAGDDPVAAFERLRGEVSLLRHAVEGLTAARESIDIPDYRRSAKNSSSPAKNSSDPAKTHRVPPRTELDPIGVPRCIPPPLTSSVAVQRRSFGFEALWVSIHFFLLAFHN